MSETAGSPFRNQPSGMPGLIKTLMVVDDSRELRRSAERTLRDTCRVIAVATPAEAIGLVGHETIDLAAIDLFLPGASGIDLLFELRRRKRDLLAIVISGMFSAGTVRSAFLAGALDCFDKPFTWGELLQRFEGVLRVERQHDEFPTFDRIKWEYYNQLLAAFQGNVTRAARHARIHRTSLQRIRRNRPNDRPANDGDR